MLDQQKILMIELLVDGETTKTDVAKKLGISRTALYNWLEESEVKAELDRRIQERKNLCQKIIDSKLYDAIKILWDTIETTKDTRVKGQLLTYIIDRALGKPTSSIDFKATMDQKDEVPKDVLEAEIEEWEEEMEE